MCNSSPVLKSFLDIKKQFLLSVPLKIFEWQDVFSSLKADTSAQKFLLDITTGCKEVKMYPIKNSYQKLFLKHIINKLEAESCEIDDDIYNTYCYLVSREPENNTGDKTSHFRHYTLPSKQLLTSIVLQESVNLLSAGTTGLSSWQAGAALAEWCISHKSEFRGKNVLELGSGCGLTGIVAAVMCEASQVVLSDGHEAVMEQLSQNVIINLGALEKSLSDGERVKTKVGDTNVSVQYQPWAQIPTSWQATQAPDLILAADVVFDPELFTDLKDALVYLLKLKPESSRAILACTLRNHETLNCFLDMLKHNNMSIEQDNKEIEEIFYYDKTVPVNFYILKYNSSVEPLANTMQMLL